MELFAQDSEERIVVDCVEIRGDVSLDEPPRSGPCGLDVLEGSVTTTLRSEAVRMVAKLRLEVGFKDQANDFLQQLVAPCWNA